VHLDFPETAYFLELVPLRGHGELSIGNTTLNLAPGSGVIVSPNISWQLRCTADYEHLALKIDAHALTAKLAAMTGTPVDRELQIEAQQDPPLPQAKIMTRYIRSLVDTLSTAEPTTPLPAWWAAQTEQLLMTMVLCCSRHNYSHLLDEDPPEAALAEVRRAEDYIAANWQRPITLEDLAAVSGVSAFSLYRSFRLRRGCSPLQFLAQIRAREARAR
jgi:AraC-binding-like domain/Bacterial regulatory helix-turn-helix proteins, AraC family